MAFDLSGLRAADTSTLDIKHPVTGEPTGWIWTIAGPGHPKTLARGEKIQRAALLEAKLKEQARVNGKKWRGDDKSPEEARAENVANIAERVVDFSPVILDEGGTETVYSPEVANRILLDPTYGWLFGQIVDFMVADDTFFRHSDAR